MAIPKYIREEFLKMLRNNRANERCKLVQGLIQEAKDEHPTTWEAYQEAKDRYDSARAAWVEVESNCGLTEEQLRERTYGCTKVAKNPTLNAYDVETEKLKSKMLVTDKINPAEYGLGELEE